MFIIESYQYDKTGSTFVGYLATFNATGHLTFTRNKQEAHQFASKEECIISDNQSWDMGRDGGRGYYRIVDIPEKEHNIPGISNKTLNLIIRKKTLWAEIKAMEQEYVRLGKQIHQVEQDRKDVSFRIQKKINESQEIAEKLDAMEYEALKLKEYENRIIILPDSKIKGRDLEFISWIKRDGTGTEDVSSQDNSHLNDTVFTLNCLSLSNKTYIASEFNSYVVKLKSQKE